MRDPESPYSEKRLSMLLQGQPSSLAFGGIRSILDSEPESSLPSHLYSQIDSVLATWPDWTRSIVTQELPLDKYVSAISWPLVRRLDTELGAEEFVAAIEMNSAGNLRAVRVSVFSDDCLAALQDWEGLQQLNDLSLRVISGSGRSLSTLLKVLPGSLQSFSCFCPSPCEDVWDAIVEYISSPRASGLVRLRLSIVPTSVVQKLSICPPVGLRSVALSVIDPLAIGTLLSSPSLCENLHRLDLPSNSLGDSGVEEISSCPYLRQLRSLSLADNSITGRGVEFLRTASFMSTLAYLCLDRNRLGDAGGVALASFPFKSLDTLNLFNTHLAQDSVLALSDSVHLDGLRTLHLGMNPIGHKGAVALSCARWFKSIESLNIEHGDVDESGIGAILERPHLSFVELWLGGNSMSSDVLEALSHSSRTSLRYLSLSNSAISDSGLVNLCKVSWPALKSLILANTPIGDAGIEAITRCPGMPRLLELNLFGTLISDNSFRLIGASSVFLGLVSLVVSNTVHSEQAACFLANSQTARYLQDIQTSLHIRQWGQSPTLNVLAKAKLAHDDKH